MNDRVKELRRLVTTSRGAPDAVLAMSALLFSEHLDEIAAHLEDIAAQLVKINTSLADIDAWMPSAGRGA